MEITVQNAELVARRLEQVGDVAWAAVVAVVIAHGLLAETAVKRHASGRPGPNAPTGDYRRSWETKLIRDGDSVYSVTGTNRPQGRRLEYGFHGVDALGRHYNQPPFPHVQPARDEVEPLLRAAVLAALKAATK